MSVILRSWSAKLILQFFRSYPKKISKSIQLSIPRSSFCAQKRYLASLNVEISYQLSSGGQQKHVTHHLA
ncbi:MAG: hypothetical protein DRR16_27950 [Candidatus Parabeggiatoa sp. nov. 3]|nr:MAG: hypothetical protein DRQ99_22740 [Gammaproteobacteria bacterium]RKZ78300.1 MAG: hypothetical protein DRR16_27950 [Gammaproteobacteria bacterium]